ncbi:MAG: hypothetical protein ACOH2L_01925 [Devosia sp.]
MRVAAILTLLIIALFAASAGTNAQSAPRAPIASPPGSSLL